MPGESEEWSPQPTLPGSSLWRCRPSLSSPISRNECLVYSVIRVRGPKRPMMTDLLTKKPPGPEEDMRGSALTRMGVCALGEYENSAHAPTVRHRR